jgi:pseudouridine-5'-phosphate glycosidase
VIRIAEEVGRAGVRAVALETSVVAHGLPPPHNLEAARRCARAVREAGALPAFVAVIGGQIVVGASDEDLARLADPARKPAKAGSRDLAALCASGADAGTTVSATCAIAAQAGLRVFATGGIGGVHRFVWPSPTLADVLDISSDLVEMSRRPVCVVSAGPKAILDVPATAEALETLGVPVIGYRTSELPAFYTEGSGIALEHRVEDAAQMAKLLRVHWDGLGFGTGVLLAVPPPAPLPGAEIEAAISAALAEAHTRRLPGKEVTPFLLSRVAEATEGRSVRANLLLLENNARVAAEVAVALAAAS